MSTHKSEKTSRLFSLELEDFKRLLNKKTELNYLIELSAKRMKNLLKQGYAAEDFNISEHDGASWVTVFNEEGGGSLDYTCKYSLELDYKNIKK